jgi:hypothetical protein
MPVVEHDTQRLIGIVSLGDLATRHSAKVDRRLEEISTPETAHLSLNRCAGVRYSRRPAKTKKPDFSGFRANTLIPIGRGERIRTSDPLHPMQVRYQAALRPDKRAIIAERLIFPPCTFIFPLSP